MMGFDWPLHVARTAGDTGRVRNPLTTSPAIFGNASVALATHVLPAEAGLLAATSKAAEAAHIVTFRIYPSPPDRKTRTQKAQHVDCSLCGTGCKRRLVKPGSVGQHGTHIRLGNDRAVDLGITMKPPHGLAPRDAAHVIFDGVARQNRLAELALVDG